jgi:hypothetical protein
MKFIIVFAVVVMNFSSIAQDYLITALGEKIECKITIRNHQSIKTNEANGAKKRYRPKDISEYHINGQKYLSAKIRGNSFGKVIVEGKMSLVVVSIKTSSSNVSNSTKTVTHSTTQVYYVSVLSVDEGKYSRADVGWKKKMGKWKESCSEFKDGVDALNSTESTWLEYRSNVAGFYNKSCK